MKKYRISIPLPPHAKGRGRAVRFGNKTRVITPSETRNYEAIVADLASGAVGSLLLAGPLSVKIWAVFPRTKEQSRILKKTGRPKHSPDFLWATKSRQDVDNISKTILDALNGVAWLDDRQVVDLEIHKVIAEMVETADGWKSGAGRVEIQIAEYSNEIGFFEPPLWCRGGSRGD